MTRHTDLENAQAFQKHAMQQIQELQENGKLITGFILII
jgi:hypothetical protein